MCYRNNLHSALGWCPRGLARPVLLSRANGGGGGRPREEQAQGCAGAMHRCIQEGPIEDSGLGPARTFIAEAQLPTEMAARGALQPTVTLAFAVSGAV